MEKQDKTQENQKQPEYLNGNQGFTEDTMCLCGPDPMQNKFWHCDEFGKLMNFDDPNYKHFILCTGCGRIINGDSLLVVGKRNVDSIDEEIDNLNA